ncbi:DNA polymerase-3 subunit epsilon [Streptomyces sp. Amel2xB2]|uniref:3'-5' exonuclease n=1 Tax=Streptomyces sp. Amel2xB2 TaxID=1305829 RepID=UPI000DB8FE31|nr:3'-5' exonuclease [Streptomyces sp. Amel2xB2]RAJ70211.1 DNA polymerase-3 subunit epsilon [Streptomyces sp. Amel2xB2]
MTWHTQRMCGFDTETNHRDPEQARIVTACIVHVGGGTDTHATNWLSDIDGEDIPDEAAAIHGVTTEHAHATGQPAAEVTQEITALLRVTAMDGVPVVAMNARYDFTVLDREARRHGVAPLGELHVIDPFVLDKHVDRYRRGGRTLTDLCTHYRVPLDGAHSADADAIAACRVAWRIAEAHPHIAAMTLPELHAAQIGWAREQADSLAGYFARTPGKEHQAAGVRGDWPLVPFKEVAV